MVPEEFSIKAMVERISSYEKGLVGSALWDARIRSRRCLTPCSGIR